MAENRGRQGGRPSEDGLFRRIEQATAVHQSGRPQEALTLYRGILEVSPDEPRVLNLAGIAAYQTGDLDTAAGLLTAALRQAPDDAETHYNLGLVEISRKRFAEAATALEASLRIDPANAEACNSLGNARRQLEQPDEAMAAYRRAVALRADYAAAIKNLGTLSLALGDPAAACEAFQRLLELEAPRPGVLRDLAKAFTDLGRIDDAIAALRQALGLSPDDPDTVAQLGSALGAADDLEEAEATIRRAIALAPGRAGFHCNLGSALERQGRFEEAETAYAEALSLDPDHVPSLRNLGALCRDLGRFEDAEEPFRRVLALRPEEPVSLLDLTVMKTFTKDDPDLDRLQAFLEAPELAESDRQVVHFRLAKALDDLGEYDAAFDHLQKANAIKLASLEDGIDPAVDLLTRTAEVFGHDLLTQPPGDGFASDLPVFIVGMPRSGTTLVEQIVASHPDVHGAGETSHLEKLAGGMRSADDAGARYPELGAGMGPRDLLHIGETYVERLSAYSPDVRRITDKMPSNFRYLGLIRLALPKAKVIHCTRDPVATCFSCYQQGFAGKLDFTYDLTHLGRYYRAYHDLMDHWRRVLGEWVLDVAYEDVVREPEGQIRRMLAFCGLPWNDACLSFHETKRPVRTASQAQVRKPIYATAVDHWRHYERHLGPLFEALGPLAGRG
ncbi:MAG: sulfotransferase [Rhodospirillales bacterium]